MMVFLTPPLLFALNVIIIINRAVDIERLCRLAGVDARTAAQKTARKEKEESESRQRGQKGGKGGEARPDGEDFGIHEERPRLVDSKIGLKQ